MYKENMNVCILIHYYYGSFSIKSKRGRLHNKSYLLSLLLDFSLHFSLSYLAQILWFCGLIQCYSTQLTEIISVSVPEVFASLRAMQWFQKERQVHMLKL